MDELRRRAAEWRDIEFSLDKINEHIKAKFGEKWPDDNDKQTLKVVSDYLDILLQDVRIRYKNVIYDQIMASYPEEIKKEILCDDTKEAENEQVH